MSHVFSTPDEDATPVDDTAPRSIDPHLSQPSDFIQALFKEKQLLQEQVNTQTQFIHLLLHQLATPLTSLQGSVHLLSEPALSAEQRQEFLDLLQQQVRHLEELLQSLVALRNLETGALDVQPTAFCLKEVTEDVVNLFRDHAIVCYLSPDLPLIWGDRWQVSQVLLNLVSNAIKYSPAATAVEIGADRRSADWLEVWVRDHGLGIPAEAQPHLFERFYRVRHHDRANIPGTGLGLSLCKLLIENQGGQIGFESTHGEGSRFFFTLPTSKSPLTADSIAP